MKKQRKEAKKIIATPNTKIIKSYYHATSTNPSGLNFAGKIKTKQNRDMELLKFANILFTLFFFTNLC